MNDHDDRWLTVGEEISRRMAELGRSQAEVARGAELSAITVRRLMRGQPGNYRKANLARLCRALDWSHDSIDRILVGELPVDAERALQAATSEWQRLKDQGASDAEIHAAQDRMDDASRHYFGSQRRLSPLPPGAASSAFVMPGWMPEVVDQLRRSTPDLTPEDQKQVGAWAEAFAREQSERRGQVARAFEEFMNSKSADEEDPPP